MGLSFLNFISGNLGIDIFRLDAIPYLSKEVGTSAENLPKTHAIIRLLSNYIQMTAPRTVIQAEACQWPNDILPYFGKDRKVKVDIDGQEKTVAVTDTITVEENVLNINIGLREKLIFDLELNKYISRIAVQTSKETKSFDYENDTFGKVEIFRFL